MLKLVYPNHFDEVQHKVLRLQFLVASPFDPNELGVTQNIAQGFDITKLIDLSQLL